MTVRNLYKTLAFYICMALAAVVAFGLFPRYRINDRNSQEFSAYRVSDDIRVISKEPHSIQHTKERKVLAEFLFHRLQQMGGDTQIIEYDTIPSKIGGKFSYANIYSKFEPEHGILPDRGDSTVSYLLLVAHYDSRYRQIVGKDTVFSYGAADDGYGVGTILELANLALAYRSEWYQGVKVLFTDAEEHNLDGMRSAFAENSEVFEGVNFVINVEARGVKGPALLFETSPGNEKLMELYAHANNPSGFSLTSMVYRFLPNDTDFSVVKDSIPGLNFAVIDNLHYYHTNLDNYYNISLESLQHYGDQLAPVVREYLTNKEYSGADALKGEDDTVFFALPVLGLFAFSKGGYAVLNTLFYLFFIFVCFIYVKYKMVPLKGILRALVHVVLFALVALASGTAAAYISALHTGLPFELTDLRYVPYDNKMALAFVLVFAVWILVFSRLQERRYKLYAWNLLLASQMLLGAICAFLLFFCGENFFFFVPFAFATIALFFSIARNFKWLYLVSCTVAAFVALYFMYLLYVALTIGFIGGLMFMAVIYLSLIISQYYCMKRSIL